MVKRKQPGALGESDRHQRSGVSAGDAASFEELVDAHWRHLFRLAYSIVGERSGAEDVVQETFLAAFSRMGSFRGESSVKTWLISILVRQAAKYKRREGIRRHKGLDEVRRHEGGKTAEGADAKLDLAWALEGLGEAHRDVIVLRELEGLSYEEIAQVLGVPRGTVESRLYRARRALRVRLRDYEA